MKITQNKFELYTVQRNSKPAVFVEKNLQQADLKSVASPALKMYGVSFAGNLKSLKYPKAKQVRIVSFGANEGKSQNRGLMMHISHLPATRSHIGQFLDPETEKFTQFLQDAKQTHWIMNPLTSIGDDLCPYNSSSRFDRNKYLINLNKLVEPEYGKILKPEDLPDESSARSFTLDMLREQKDPRFKLAFDNFRKLDEAHPLKQEFNEYFKKEGPNWLDNNAIHESIVSFVLSKDVAGYDWRTWPEALKMFPENTKGQTYEQKLKALKGIEIDGKKLDQQNFDKIEQFRFEQFLFDKQFKGFKKDLDKKGITLFVDLAYTISPDGKDVWTNKDMVCLNKENNYKREKLPGCMPEPAYPETQIWAGSVWNLDSPQYWEYQENSMRKMFEEGCVRLDHFGGLINRGAIPAVIKDKDGREYPIREAMEKHIELPKPYEGWNGKDKDGKWRVNLPLIEKTKADEDTWCPEWLEDVSQKTNDKGETLLDMYIRVAEESGLEPENAFVVEDLGGVCYTDTFKKTMEKYGDKLSGLRLPVAYGVESTIGSERSMYGNPHDPWCNDVNNPEKFALLSGSHDPPTMMETTEITLSRAKRDESGNILSPEQLEEKGDPNLKDSSYWMLKLARDAGVKPEEMKLKEDNNEDTYYNVTRKVLEWMYKKPAKHMQTTISDALGIYFRPNIPGKYGGHSDCFYMKQTPVGQFNFWSTRFPKGFLDRDDKGGINPGYKEKAQNFIKMMQDLFPDKSEEVS